MRTTDFIKGKEEQVAEYFGFVVTGNKHHDCPVCGKKKSYRLNRNGDYFGWICTCGNGGIIDLVQQTTGREFKDVAQEIDRQFGNIRDYVAPVRNTKLDRAKHLWMESSYIHGTDGQSYLNSRGLYAMPRRGIKFGSVYDHDLKRKVPAMIAIASDNLSSPKVLHVTYVENGQKADVETQRKMHSLAGDGAGCAIKLSEATDILGIAEGIESALSAASVYRMPTWSTMNASYMKKFRAPTGVKVLYIYADNDSNGTGLAAAFECGNRNILANNDVVKVVIRWPENLNDFNDLIIQGDKVLEWTLHKPTP